MVIWLTGLSGAGKSTIASELMTLMKPIHSHTVLIDGDVIRQLFGAGLGFDEASRVEQIGRLQRLALWLSGQDIPCIVAALYSNDELLRWNRENLTGYVEVYVSAALDILIERDTKGLYSKYLSGNMNNVVGMDIPWNPPSQPDLILETSGPALPHELAERVMQYLDLNIPAAPKGRS